MRRLAALALLAMTTAQAAGIVAPEQLAQQLRDAKAAPFVLDVRTAEEFAGGRVPGALNVPVGELEAKAAVVPKDRPLVVYCHSGIRAQKASRLLAQLGYRNVAELQGSFMAWERAGLPVEK